MKYSLCGSGGFPSKCCCGSGVADGDGGGDSGGVGYGVVAMEMVVMVWLIPFIYFLSMPLPRMS